MFLLCVDCNAGHIETKGNPRTLPRAEGGELAMVWRVGLTLLGKDQATSRAGFDEETQRHPCKSRPQGSFLPDPKPTAALRLCSQAFSRTGSDCFVLVKHVD